MKSSRLAFVLMSALLLPALVFADKAPKISQQTRFALIRVLNAEMAYTRVPFPAGAEGYTLTAEGKIKNKPDEIRQAIAQVGLMAKPGERVQITSVEFKGNSIVFELNGGPKKKKKWYERIEFGGNGGMTTVPQDTSKERATGSTLSIAFKDYIPEISAAEVKQIIAPVLDFTVKSTAEAYLDTVPPQVKQAIKDHKVLVGMNKEMVTYAVGRPAKKIREKSQDGTEYEEWIYGDPPQDVNFVRFIGDEVAQLKIMKIDGEKIVKTEKEVDLTPKDSLQAKSDEAPADAKPRPAGAPTLRRPGEAAPEVVNHPGTTPQRMPGTQPGATSPTEDRDRRQIPVDPR